MTEKQAEIIINLLREIALELKASRYLQSNRFSGHGIEDDEIDNVVGG